MRGYYIKSSTTVKLHAGIFYFGRGIGQKYVASCKTSTPVAIPKQEKQHKRTHWQVRLEFVNNKSPVKCQMCKNIVCNKYISKEYYLCVICVLNNNDDN